MSDDIKWVNWHTNSGQTGGKKDDAAVKETARKAAFQEQLAAQRKRDLDKQWADAPPYTYLD